MAASRSVKLKTEGNLEDLHLPRAQNGGAEMGAAGVSVKDIRNTGVIAWETSMM